MEEHDKSRIERATAAWNRTRRVFSRYPSALLLLLVFGVEVGVGVFVIRDLRTANLEAENMYARSVLGLRQIGELQYEAQETRRATLYALTTNDSNRQVDYADQSREADRRVTEGIKTYLEQARIPLELEVGRRLQRDWAAYLSIRDEVLGSILEGSTKEAVDLDLSGGVPSFDRVSQELEEIKRLYDEQASAQLAVVAASSHRSTVRLIAIVCFTLIFATFSVWAIQRSRMASTVQLAKMQMDFVAGISHELRTPLAVIQSAAENIADGVVGGKDQLARYGSVIRNQSRQITEMVNEILLFASTRDNKKRYSMRRLQVSEIVDTVLANTAELVRGSGFTVEREVEPNLPLVMGDLAALSQCLQNLVGNAIKYSGQARSVHLHACLEPARNQGHSEVRIAVRDHGIGIETSEIQRIFEPFYRSPSVSLSPIRGTGLGLTLAKNIAESMGGKLSVESKLGAGSVFTLHLPIIREAQSGALASNPGTEVTSKT
jgi:signal transduction histidine kinase